MDIAGRVLKTTTEDGLELDAILFEPKEKTSTIVIHFHGKEGDFLQNHFIERMALDYPASGFAFMTASHRGKSYMADILRKSATGYEYTQLGSAFDMFEESHYDIDAWVQRAKTLGFERVVLQQHSTPHKITWYVSQNPRLVHALILISPADMLFLFETYVKDYRKNLRLAQQMVESGRAKELMPVTLWSNCPVSAGTFYNWGNPKSPFLEFNYRHPEIGFRYFPSIKMPILAIAGENDFSVGGPTKRCLQILQEKSTSSSFMAHVISGAPHSYLGYEKQLTTNVLAWLKQIVL